MPDNALRLSQSITVSDAILVAAGVTLIAGVLVRASSGHSVPRVPVWLLVAGAGLVVAALLVELFPPEHLSAAAGRAVTAASLYAQNDPTAPTGIGPAASNAVVAARWTAALLCVPVILGILGTSWTRLRLLVTVWLAGVAISCSVAVTSWLNLLSAADILGRDYTLLGGAEADRFTGLTVHPTQLGTIAAMALPIVVVRLAKRVRAGDLLLAVVFVVGIMLSGSRAPLFGAIAGVAAAFAIMHRGRVRVGVVALCGALVAITAALADRGPFAIVARLSSGSASAASSDTARVGVYGDTINAILDRPFVGYGFDVSRVGHSLYLGLLEAGGVIAFAAFMCFAAGLLHLGVSLARDDQVSSRWQAEAVGLTGAVIAWLSLSLVQNSVFDRFLYIPAGLLIALAHNARVSATPSGPVPVATADTVPATLTSALSTAGTAARTS